jgi:hypothetical protein
MVTAHTASKRSKVREGSERTVIVYKARQQASAEVLEQKVHSMGNIVLVERRPHSPVDVAPAAIQYIRHFMVCFVIPSKSSYHSMVRSDVNGIVVADHGLRAMGTNACAMPMLRCELMVMAITFQCRLRLA